jgi:simple sugar transport system permease protein
MFLSGAICGIAGMTEIAGLQGRLQSGFSGGFGYTAIIVAWLARLNPLSVLFVSFFMGILLVGGDTLQIVMRLPLSSTLVIQGLILFFLLGGEFFRRYRIKLITGKEQ